MPESEPDVGGGMGGVQAGKGVGVGYGFMRLRSWVW